MTFGNRLRRLRKEHDMTQENVAKRLNIVRSTYAYYETGKTYPDFDTVVKVSILFGVTTDYLLGAPKMQPVLRDTTRTNYSLDAQYTENEWILRESEQRLITAYRYLDSLSQEKTINEIERVASEIYEKKIKGGSSGAEKK